MKLSAIILLQLLLSCTRLNAQKEANVWLFDRNIGWDFNTGERRDFTSPVDLEQEGATASICEPQTGRLVLFTNGRTVWNASYRPIKNGYGLHGGKYTDQACIIIPSPGNSNEYYIFTTKSITDNNPEGAAGLYYSMVNMDENNGLGEIKPNKKNILLSHNASDKLIATPTANKDGFWIITHEGTSNRFATYLVDDQGVSEPQYFEFGPVYNSYRSKGWLQVSPNGKLVLCAVSSDGFEKNPLELYDFDNVSGELSNRRNLGNYPELIGVAFSPNNSKIYFTEHDQTRQGEGSMYQMDLSNGSDEAAITQSKTRIYALHNPFPGKSNQTFYDTIQSGVLQLAPDGRLYLKYMAPYEIGTEQKYLIYCIEKPNLAGLNCAPTGKEFTLPFDRANGISFPNMITSYFNAIETDTTSKNSCHAEYDVFPNPFNTSFSITTESDCIYPFQLILFNALGQKILKQTVSSPQITITLTEQSSQILFIMLKSRKGEKIVKILKK